MFADIQLIYPGFGSIGGLYLSNSKTIEDIALLQSFNIRSLLCASANLALPQIPKNTIIQTLYIPLDQNSDFEQFLDRSFNWIERVRRKGNTLIYCGSGMNRSAAMMAGYLIRKYRLQFGEAIEKMIKIRPSIDIDKKFINILLKESKSYGISEPIDFKKNNKINDEDSYLNKRIVRVRKSYSQLSQISSDSARNSLMQLSNTNSFQRSRKFSNITKLRDVFMEGSTISQNISFKGISSDMFKSKKHSEKDQNNPEKGTQSLKVRQKRLTLKDRPTH